MFLAQRPTRLQSRRMASSLSFAFLAFITLICLFTVSVKAEEPISSEYGTVIGIGGEFKIMHTERSAYKVL
jgi:heat shock protein 5